MVGAYSPWNDDNDVDQIKAKKDWLLPGRKLAYD
jgi:hypothetical protein